MGGAVRVTGPGIDELYVPVGEDGRYVVHVREAGLYNLFGIHPPSLASFAPLVFTTPNPLEVVLVPGSDGHVRSFEHADFGVANALEPHARPVGFAEEGSLVLDHYALLDIRLEDYILWMRVGFGGCSPDHPVQLYMVAGFMESLPVQARLLLSHDDRGELCDAWFERDLAWDLRPIMERYRQEYGEFGVVILHFDDWQGERHTFELIPPRTKDEG